MRWFLITSRDRRLYDVAVRVAKDSDCDDRHGAVIALGPNIYVVATNRRVGHPTSHRWLKRTLHAEQRAVLRLHGEKYRGGAFTLYSARDHESPTSAPCRMCKSLLRESGLIRHCVYHDGQMLLKVSV